MLRIRLLCFVLSAFLKLTCADGPQVHTKYGIIQGFNTDKSQVFHGIPYAAPPIGSLRWQPPVDAAKWAPAILNATEIKPGCPQYDCAGLNPPMVCPKKISEDCLYLDIFAPLGTTPSSRLAVMVYIHGGNFVHMSGSSLLYDGQVFTQKGGVILVDIDYRLGALGFMVTGESENDAVGNYGILDQQKALQWVYNNIEAFGGDATRITLFGQSAGAQSVMIHLSLENSVAYFRNAIVESSPLAIPYKTFLEAKVLSGYLSELLECPLWDMNCLRSRKAEDIAFAQHQARSKISSLKLLEAFEPWGPWIDGKLLKQEPVAAFQTGQFFPKPVMIGTTSQETRLYIYSAWSKPVSVELYYAVLFATYPEHFRKVLSEYPVTNPSDERTDLTPMSTDLVFICPTRNATRNIIRHGVNLFHYVYSHAFSFPGWGNLTFCQGYVCHGSEVPLLFQTATLAGFKYTPDELKLSELLIEYWTNFAKTSDPNNGDGPNRMTTAPKWPSYSPENKYLSMNFTTPQSFAVQNIDNAHCDFWDDIGYSA